MISNPDQVIIVEGKPAPKGSWSPITRGGKTRFIPSNKNSASWQKKVKEHCIGYIDEPFLKPEAFRIGLSFCFKRPKSHFGTGRNSDKLKPNAPKYMIKTPDLDKLERSILDAMTGIIYEDDSQVADLISKKRYSDEGKDGVIIYIERIKE